MRLEHEGGPLEARSRRQPAAIEDRRLDESPGEIGAPGAGRNRLDGDRGPTAVLRDTVPGRSDDADRFDLDRAPLGPMAEEIGVAILEGLPERLALPVRNLDHRVLPREAKMDKAAAHLDLAPGHPLGLDHPARLRRQLLDEGRDARQGTLERLEDLSLGEALEDRVLEAEGAQKPRVGRHHDVADAQALRDGAGMLASGAAEGDQRVIHRIVAAAQRDRPDGVRHPLVGDVKKAREHRLRRRRLRGLLRQRLLEIGRRAGRRLLRDRNAEAPGIEAPEEEVDVRQGQRPAGAVAGGPRAGAGAARSHPQAAAVEPAQRTAARGDALDGERRRDQVRVAHPVLEGVVVIAVEAGDVGARASHVEGDEFRETGPPAGERRADHAARGTAQEHVLRPDGFDRDQAAGAGHDVQPASGRARTDAIQVRADDRRQVRIDHRGLGAWQDLDERRKARGARHVP